MSDDSPDLLDLRLHQSPALLAAFTRLYDETFTDPSEREDAAEWPDRLWGREGDITMHLLVSPVEGEDVISAGLAFEYFPKSRCGLLTYLAVRPQYRRRGLARTLVNRATTILADDARRDGGTLQAVLAETESPRLISPAESSIPPFERLKVFENLGARWIDIPYVQPALTPGGSRCRHLLLVAFPLLEGHPPSVDAILAFLEELYQGLGVVEPLRDPDYLAMRRALNDTLGLKSLTEVAP
jgi:GNAT superfamily N-acetyltransferase